MNNGISISPASTIILLSRGVFIELLRKKDVYVLAIFMLIFALGVFAAKVVGIENGSTGTFFLNLGLTMVYLFAHIVALLLAFNQIPREIEHRSLYPILARPVDRPVYIVGKWFACTAAGILTYMALFIIGYFSVPKMEAYQAASLMQMILLHFLSLGMMSALAIAASLFVARGINLVLLGVWFVFGGKLLFFLQGRFGESAARGIVDWGLGYLPAFNKLNLVTRYTDGIAGMAGGEFVGLFAYGALFTGAALATSVLAFSRRSL